MVSSPCCPSMISWTKVKNPNHTIGVMSTPKAGGMALRIARKNGSVGQTTTDHGNSLTFVVGYHDNTTRQSLDMRGEGKELGRGQKTKLAFTQDNRFFTVNLTIKKEKKLRKGSKTEASGCTHACVSATTKEEANDDDVSTMMDGSSWRLSVVVVVEDDTIPMDVDDTLGTTGANPNALSDDASSKRPIVKSDGTIVVVVVPIYSFDWLEERQSELTSQLSPVNLWLTTPTLCCCLNEFSLSKHVLSQAEEYAQFCKKIVCRTCADVVKG